MSWQDYVEKQLLASKCVTKAAIVGHDGNIWAKSEGFDLSKDELTKLVQGFEKQDILTSSGVTLAGTRYIYLSGTDRVIRAKLGKVGVHCMKTTQGRQTSVNVFGKKMNRQVSRARLTVTGRRLVPNSLAGSFKSGMPASWRFGDVVFLLVPAVVVSLYEDPIQPQQAASVVEKLGDYLVNCGY